ncbi:hypothetical protein [Alteromonas macleodii]|uniref:hypothetical protein n=1 Tax=Alteromonas macleodii TaxID=28108 RepID=UPI002FE139DA
MSTSGTGALAFLRKENIVAPAGTVDPTSTLYNTTMYAMAGLLAFIVNLLVKPVREKHHVENTHPELDPARAS